MSQTAYAGLPGSGKSYGVVENVILPALKDGRRVWTNIPLNMELIENEFPSKVVLFDTSDLRDDPAWFQETFEQGATIVIDEAWRLWPAGLKANQMAEAHKSFLAEHRHMVGADGYSTEIVLVTQDLSQIAAYPRSLVETTYRAVKLNMIGQSKKFRIDVFQGAATGNNPPKKDRLRQLYSSYKPDIYKYYQSQTMSENEGHGSEDNTDKRVNILTSPWLRIGAPIGLVLALVFIFYAVGRVSDMYSGKSEKAAVVDGLAGGVISAPVVKKKHSHFYAGMNPYIAWNMGKYPYVDYKLGFSDKGHSVVLTPATLGKMGYRLIGYGQCFVQLIGYGDTLNVYCEAQKDENIPSPIIDL